MKTRAGTVLAVLLIGALVGLTFNMVQGREEKPPAPTLVPTVGKVAIDTPTPLIRYEETIAAIEIDAAKTVRDSKSAELEAENIEVQRQRDAAWHEAEMRALEKTQQAELHQVSLDATRQAAATMDAEKEAASTRSAIPTLTIQGIEQDDLVHQVQMAADRRETEAEWVPRIESAKGLAKMAPWMLIAVVCIMLSVAIAIVFIRAATTREVEHKIVLAMAAATGHAADIIEGRYTLLKNPDSPVEINKVDREREISTGDIVEFLEVAVRLNTLAQTQTVNDPAWRHGAGFWRRIMNCLKDDGEIWMEQGKYVPRKRSIEQLYHLYANDPPTLREVDA